MYMCCVLNLGCGRGVLKWKLRIERLEVFLNVFTGFCKFGKVRQTEETLADFLKKSKCLKTKKKNLPLHFRIIF